MDRKKPPSPYEVRMQQEAESRKRQQVWDAEMRERAKVTIANAEAQEAEQARAKAAAAEADFRAGELQKYLAAGGSEFSFDMNWTRLRQEIVEERWRNAPDRPSVGNTVKKTLDLRYGKRD
jgi:hypothetical protein